MEGRSSYDEKEPKTDNSSSIQCKSEEKLSYFAQFSNKIHSLYSTFVSYIPDRNKINQFLHAMKPLAETGVAYLIGDYVTKQLSEEITTTEQYDFVFKFLLGVGLMGYSAINRITEDRIESESEFCHAVASEALSIIYLYSSSFRASRYLLNNRISDSASLIASLGVSGLLVPQATSYAVQKYHEYDVKKAYKKGSQRSDTSLMPSGRSPVLNTYLMINRYLSSLMDTSLLFNLALISHNILHTSTAVQQFRNLPSVIAGMGPQIIKKVFSEIDRMQKDFMFNNGELYVLKIENNEPRFYSVKRHQLRNGDLVYFDGKVEQVTSSVSGEMLALKRDSKGNLTQQPEEVKYSTNLRSHNGEDVWIEFKTIDRQINNSEEINLHDIREGKQRGVLPGSKLNLNGADNFFVRIKNEKEKSLSNTYEKKSVIDQVIATKKQNSVTYAVLASLVMAGVLSKDLVSYPAKVAELLFNLTQMMIPFAETFLRDRVNERLRNDLNKNLLENKIEITDALRVVDFGNCLKGLYIDRFKQGMAVVSDKTGTLTTSSMNMLGIWTSDMDPNVMDTLKKSTNKLLPSKDRIIECFEVFACAFSNEKKGAEPEEHAILSSLNDELGQGEHLKIDILSNCHFRKTLVYNNQQKNIETLHFGLIRKLGGTLTLVDSNDRKYLVFCGVPKPDFFAQTELLKSFQTMQARTHVLSRDWCISRVELTRDQFSKIKNIMSCDNKKHEVENYLINNSDIIKGFSHYATFIIDNPVKAGAELFISQCKDLNIPVFVATGDNVKNAVNIARVLCPNDSREIYTVGSNDVTAWKYKKIPKHSTVIFSSINEHVLQIFKDLLMREECDLYLLTEKPVNFSQYKKNFIFYNNALYYIKENNNVDKVKIHNIRQFSKILSLINPKNLNHLHLTSEQINRLIYMTTGYKRPDIEERPTIVFADLSTEGKGVLARFLKEMGYFVVANGDGTNDLKMFESAHLGFGHVTEDGTYAPGVDQFANLGDKQLQRLLNSTDSFYNLFDIEKQNSRFLNLFNPLRNSQLRPKRALDLKGSKMAFELAKTVGVTGLNEMPHQHWYSVGFDLMWLLIAYNKIVNNSDVPADGEVYHDTRWPDLVTLATYAIAILQSMAAYALTGESTNWTWMMFMLGFLPTILDLIFAAYSGSQSSEHQNENTGVVIEEITTQEEKNESSTLASSREFKLDEYECREQDSSEQSNVSKRSLYNDRYLFKRVPDKQERDTKRNSEIKSHYQWRFG